MGNKVSFDYSRASSFIRDDEVTMMSKLVLDAREMCIRDRVCTCPNMLTKEI